MDTPKIPQPKAPNSSKLWKVLLLVAGGLASFGVVSAALFSNQTDQPQTQNTRPVVQESATRSKPDVQEATTTSTDSNIHQTEWPIQEVTAPTIVADPAPALQPSQTVQPTQQTPATAPNRTYTNTYGNEVPSPYVAPSKPAGASAQCNDGTYSFSQSRRGTCSHHGGVAEWY